MKKWLYRMDMPAVVLALLALASMCFTLFSASIVSGEAGKLPVCGFNLMVFTPWGFVVQLAPLMLILLAQTHKFIPQKYLILFGILLAALFGYNDGLILAREWAFAVSDGFARSTGVMMLYPLLLMGSGAMLTMHMYYADRFAAYKKEFPEDFESDMEYYEFMVDEEREVNLAEE